MVRLTNGKLIIEADEFDSADDLQMLQRDIIGAIECYDYKNYGNTDGCPFMALLWLLKATLPTYHQQRRILEFTEMTHRPVVDKNELSAWLEKQRGRIIVEPKPSQGHETNQ